MMPSLAALIRSGAVTNKLKNLNRHKNVFTLAAGDAEFYEFLDDNSSMELYPVDYVNDPYIIGQNDRVISISAFLEVGLDGAVNSEAIEGKQYSAPGGQLDFVRGAQLSKGGKSILDCIFHRGPRSGVPHRSKIKRTNHRSKSRHAIHCD